jgi:hypothetical protein
MSKIENNTKVWFKSSPLSNEIGIIKSYLGEGDYLVYAVNKEKLYITFELDIKPFN